MSRVKLLCLTAAMITVAVAIAGVNLGLSTALCENEPKEGACQTPYYQPTEIYGETFAKPVFETAAGNLVCEYSYFETRKAMFTGKGTAMKAETYELGFSCKTEKEVACTVKANNKPYLAPLTWTGGNNGQLSFEDGGKGKPTISLVCGTVINCTYNLEPVLSFQGGSSALLIASKEELGGATGTICPGAGAPVFWSASYAVLEPDAKMFVADYVQSVALCKKNETPCPVAEAYPFETKLAAVLEPETEAKFKLKIIEEGETEYTVACKASSLEGTTKQAKTPLPVTVSLLKFEECGGTCSVTAIGLSYFPNITAIGSGNGTMTFQGGSPRLRVKCIGAYKCTYYSTSFSPSISGGAPAKLSVNGSLGTLVTGESDKTCGSQLKWEGTYKFTGPESGGEPKMWVITEAT